jgi:hypothetical protein
MSTSPPAPGLAELLTAIPKGLASQRAENWLAGIVASLFLALLTQLFAGLADLMERIKAGEYQPQPFTPYQPHTDPKPRQRRKSSGRFGWQPAAMPGADGACEQPGTPVMAALVAAGPTPPILARSKPAAPQAAAASIQPLSLSATQPVPRACGPPRPMPGEMRVGIRHAQFVPL